MAWVGTYCLPFELTIDGAGQRSDTPCAAVAARAATLGPVRSMRVGLSIAISLFSRRYRSARRQSDRRARAGRTSGYAPAVGCGQTHVFLSPARHRTEHRRTSSADPAVLLNTLRGKGSDQRPVGTSRRAGAELSLNTYRERHCRASGEECRAVRARANRANTVSRAPRNAGPGFREKDNGSAAWRRLVRRRAPRVGADG